MGRPFKPGRFFRQNKNVKTAKATKKHTDTTTATTIAIVALEVGHSETPFASFAP
jgi:hypothetical protein